MVFRKMETELHVALDGRGVQSYDRSTLQLIYTILYHTIRDCTVQIKIKINRDYSTASGLQ